MNADFRFTEVPLKKNLKAYIYDNCLPVDVFKGIQKTLLGPNFSWYYNDMVLYNPVASPIKNYQNNLNVYQFTHSFFREGEYAWSSSTHIIVPILNVLEPRAWIRVKANLGPREPKPLVGGWHYDIVQQNGKPYDDTITGVLHMNTNNGYTLMETGQKVESVANRLVLFPCNTLHTGITQTDTKVRVLLNFNFFNKRKLK